MQNAAESAKNPLFSLPDSRLVKCNLFISSALDISHEMGFKGQRRDARRTAESGGETRKTTPVARAGTRAAARDFEPRIRHDLSRARQRDAVHDAPRRRARARHR